MRKLFFAQVAAAILAAAIFQVGLDPRVAGLIAGSSFVLVGLYGIRMSWPERRNRHLSLAILGMSLIHLFAIALPMLWFRILNWNQPFSKISVWGLSGPEFHQISTRLYFLWAVLVAITWWLERKKSSRKGSGPKGSMGGLISQKKIAAAKDAALKRSDRLSRNS